VNGYAPVAVKLWGDLACFTRPEFKVERVSYPMMTPSAPAVRSRPSSGSRSFSGASPRFACSPRIRYQSIQRNENCVEADRANRTQLAIPRRRRGFVASADRTALGGQRHTLALRDVSYVVMAQAECDLTSAKMPPSSAISSVVVLHRDDASPRRISDAGSSRLHSRSPPAQTCRSTRPRIWVRCSRSRLCTGSQRTRHTSVLRSSP